MKTPFTCTGILCLSLICATSFAQSTTQQPVSTQLAEEDLEYYMEKMQFQKLPGLEITGDPDSDQVRYEEVWANYKMAHFQEKPSIRPTSRVDAPPNDLCSGALPIACGELVRGSTIEATFDAAPLCGTNNTTNGVWYVFTPSDNTQVTLSTCNMADYDTKISVYTDGCGTLSCVAGQDDNIAECGLDYTTKLTFCAVGGTEYLILVHGYSLATGNFDMTITCNDALTNDDVCDAEALSLDTPTPFSNYCASAQSGEVSPGPGTGNTCNAQDGWCAFETGVQSTIWYTFSAPPSGRVSITTDAFDTQLALWSVGDCNDFGTFSEIAANDDSADDILPGAHVFAAAIIDACVVPGQTYYIQLDGFNGTQGEGLIEVIDEGATATINAGADQTVYFGYDPAACATLTASVVDAGGVDPANISWSTGETGASISVCPETTTTYTATYNDPDGCASSDEVTVCVIDVRCQDENGNSKVEICHRPDGGNPQTLCVAASSVEAHLAHGDALGSCGTVSPCDGAGMTQLVTPMQIDLSVHAHEEAGFSLFPNPASQSVNIQLAKTPLIPAEVRLIDQTMRVTTSQFLAASSMTLELGQLVPGIYMVQVIADGVSSVRKLVVTD